MRRTVCIVLVLCTASLTVPARGGDAWPQFRGQGTTSAADEAQLPVEWGGSQNIAWKAKVPGYGWSSPVIWGDKVFITTAVSDKQQKPGGGFGGGGGFAGGGRRGFGSPVQPGQILPPFLRDRLQLTADQQKQLETLQKAIDGGLAKLLNHEQKKLLEEPPMGTGRREGRAGRGGGGPPQPGQILPSAVQETLKLSAGQKGQLDEMQKDLDAKLAKLLTAEQNKQIKEMRDGFGRGGPGRGGFGGGRGGFGRGAPPDAVYRWEIACLDRDTGKVLWQRVALEGKPRIPKQGSNTYASETPVTDGERVYAYFGMHGLFCYNITGNLVWKKDLGAYPMQMGQGTGSSPVLDGDRLFLQVDNEEKSFLVALDRKSGAELWRVSRDEGSNYSTPFIWKNKLRTELVTSGGHKVRSYDPASGKVFWELSQGAGRCTASAVGDDERLYVGQVSRGGGGRGGMGGGGSGALFAVRAGASGDVTPRNGESTSAGVVWSRPQSGPSGASPLVYQGHVYILEQNGGMVSCYDAATGNPAYRRERLPGARTFWASPWSYGGKVFCLDDGGTTYVLQAGPAFKVLAKNKVDDQFWATPAVAGGTVVLRGVDSVYGVRR